MKSYYPPSSASSSKIMAESFIRIRLMFSVLSAVTCLRTGVISPVSTPSSASSSSSSPSSPQQIRLPAPSTQSSRNIASEDNEESAIRTRFSNDTRGLLAWNIQKMGEVEREIEVGERAIRSANWSAVISHATLDSILNLDPSGHCSVMMSPYSTWQSNATGSGSYKRSYCHCGAGSGMVSCVCGVMEGLKKNKEKLEWHMRLHAKLSEEIVEHERQRDVRALLEKRFENFLVNKREEGENEVQPRSLSFSVSSETEDAERGTIHRSDSVDSAQSLSFSFPSSGARNCVPFNDPDEGRSRFSRAFCRCLLGPGKRDHQNDSLLTNDGSTSSKKADDIDERANGVRRRFSSAPLLENERRKNESTGERRRLQSSLVVPLSSSIPSSAQEIELGNLSPTSDKSEIVHIPNQVMADRVREFLALDT